MLIVFFLDPAVAGLEDSKILGKNASYLKALGDFLKPVVRNGSHWKLCWRPSENDWQAQIFHSLCDDKGPTFTIVRVCKHIFGGYASRSWGK